MSDPLSDFCSYCGSPEVIDDAWWCHRLECERKGHADIEAEGRRLYAAEGLGPSLPSKANEKASDAVAPTTKDG